MKRHLASIICFLVLLSFISANALAAQNTGANYSFSGYEAPEAEYHIPVRLFSAMPKRVSLNSAKSSVAQADFVFFIDATGSMSSYIRSVRSNLYAFSLYLIEKNIDVRFSVVEYKDITEDGKSSTIIHKFNGSEWTRDISEVESCLNGINVSGGGDDPETPTDAFIKLLNGTYNNQFRPNASRFAFLLTDAEAKGSKDSSDLYDLDTIATLLRRSSVYTSVVSKTDYKDHYKPIWDQTGGIFIDIDSSNYYELMLQVADWVVESSKDTDGDGLPDTWETNGVDIDNDGTIDLDLKSMGADPNVPDIFVEVDYMYRAKSTSSFLGFKTTTEEKNLKPSKAALKLIMDQFVDHGIQIHIDAGSDYVMNPRTGKTWGSRSRSNALTYADNFNLGNNYEYWNELAVKNFDKSRWTVFRYCIFVNKYNNTSSSGIAEGIPGQFFVVADVDGWISSNSKSIAGTFMHELGHTLGLRHGGDDNMHYKANYLSIMNYFYQTSGLLGTNEVNYSDYELPAINESSINERNGLDPNGLTNGSGLGAKWRYQNSHMLWTVDENGSISTISRNSIDFNVNGSIEASVSIDLNADGNKGTFNKSINDWNSIVFKGGAIGGLGASAEENPILIYKDSSDPVPEELTLEEAREVGVLGNPGDGVIRNITPGTLYSGVNGQKLNVVVTNLSPGSTSFELILSSKLFDGDFKTTLTLDDSEEKTIVVSIPPTVQPGIYPVVGKLKCQNGETKEFEMEVSVYKCDPIRLVVGQSLQIDATGMEGYTEISQDNGIAKVSGGSIIAVKAGNTFIDILDNSANIVASIPVEVVPPAANSFEDVAVLSTSFTFKKVWEGGNEKSIDFTLYKLGDTVYHHPFNKRIISNIEWQYNAWFSEAVACYVIEKPVEGYKTRYENVGVYAGITDRCCDGGTIVNYKVPETGDDANLARWLGCVMVGMIIVTIAVYFGKREKSPL